jgi:UDP-N-acetylmuramoyl-L-alanyl-D-glutamate--2,6-diaminopimelate ligase
MSRDHLDFHGTWEAYRDAKMMLFHESRLRGAAVVNADDAEASFFVENTSGPLLTYGIRKHCDFQATDIHLSATGTSFQLKSQFGTFPVQSKLIGEFNVYNTLAILAAAYTLGTSLKDAVSAVPEINPVRGRAEVIQSNAPFPVVVDYAHTPDALEKILATLRKLTNGALRCVIGAGGDRDRGKRPLMAQAAENFSDFVYLTSDNPRSEEPMTILEDMKAGISRVDDIYMNADRRQAISDALSAAQAGDVVVIAGKGHETYQEIRGVKYPFDDAEVVRDWLRAHRLEA